MQEHKNLLWSVINRISEKNISDFKLKYRLNLSVHDLFSSVNHWFNAGDKICQFYRRAI